MRASCPKCGKPHEATTLKKLIAGVEACCTPSNKKGRSMPQFIPAEQPPKLPAVFELPRRLKSQNKTTYSHWKVHHLDKKSWTKLVGHILRPCHGLQLPWSRWSLTRLYSGREREMDFANLVGGAKPLIDTLTDYQVIVDDAPTYFSCDYSQERGGRSMTVLTLLEIGDATSNKTGRVQRPRSDT